MDTFRTFISQFHRSSVPIKPFQYVVRFLARWHFHAVTRPITVGCEKVNDVRRIGQCDVQVIIAFDMFSQFFPNFFVIPNNWNNKICNIFQIFVLRKF